MLARSSKVVRRSLAASLLVTLVACGGGDTQVTRTSGPAGGGTTGLTGTSGATGLGASGATGATSSGTTVPQACDLLTQDLVEEALGTAVDPGTSEAAPLGGSSCSYFTATKTAGATLVIVPSPNGSASYEAAKAAAQDPQNDIGFFHEISGLGDDAFTDGINVTVLSGGSSFGLVAFAADEHAGDTATAEALLARILGEL